MSLTLNKNLLPTQKNLPNQRWEQQASEYLKNRKAKEITALVTGIFATMAVIAGSLTLVVKGAQEMQETDSDGNIKIALGVPSLVISFMVGIIGISCSIYRIHTIATNAIFPYNLVQPGEVIKIRSKLLEESNENLESISQKNDCSDDDEVEILVEIDPMNEIYASLNSKIFVLKQTGILTPELAESLQIIFKRYKELQNAKAELKDYDDKAISENASLKDRKATIQQSIKTLFADWKTFQENELTPGLPNPSLTFTVLD